MGFVAWLRRSIGRTLAAPKTHLIETAALLGFKQALIEQMRASDDEECESIFWTELEAKCGQTVDWRAKPSEVLDAVLRYLPHDEQLIIEKIDLDPSLSPSQTVRVLASGLSKSGFTLRALDSFGDFYFIIVLPRKIESAFDAANAHWIE